MLTAQAPVTVLADEPDAAEPVTALAEDAVAAEQVAAEASEEEQPWCESRF